MNCRLADVFVDNLNRCDGGKIRVVFVRPDDFFIPGYFQQMRGFPEKAVSNPVADYQIPVGRSWNPHKNFNGTPSKSLLDSSQTMDLSGAIS